MRIYVFEFVHEPLLLRLHLFKLHNVFVVWLFVLWVVLALVFFLLSLHQHEIRVLIVYHLLVLLHAMSVIFLVFFFVIFTSIRVNLVVSHVIGLSDQPSILFLIVLELVFCLFLIVDDLNIVMVDDFLIFVFFFAVLFIHFVHGGFCPA